MKCRIGILLITVLSGAGCSVDKYTPAPIITPSGAVYFTPGTDCEDNIIREINNAQKIDIAVYSITNQNIANSIFAAHNRGADIRIITDRTMARGRGSMVPDFIAAGIPLRHNRRHKIEHNKFAIFDGARIVTGSYNWTANATRHNSENCLFLNAFAPEYAGRFERLWTMYGK